MKSQTNPIVDQELIRALKFMEKVYPTPRDTQEFEVYERFMKTVAKYLRSRFNTVFKAGKEEC